jgi:hypothetical protein
VATKCSFWELGWVGLDVRGHQWFFCWVFFGGGRTIACFSGVSFWGLGCVNGGVMVVIILGDKTKESWGELMVYYCTFY